MRPLLLSLLLAALCADLAPALHCHVCCGHKDCESLVECAPTDKYCVITQASEYPAPSSLSHGSPPNPGGILVMKSCAPVCPNSTMSSDGRTLSVSCCQGSQCNRSAAVGLAGGRGVLWLSTSASLLWPLLRAAW
ncbi:ly6/PLAUR domain-containing protein 2-like [Ursus americanus]|uniref:ly6/PLAUR domain-containing protein 2-like n=1 Tax=Ursus americanus TaxID=9643 RepID=UPI001E67C0A0|nr:ly6/PLAUR domain-containing protein 2-like [Ursus americanus]